VYHEDVGALNVDVMKELLEGLSNPVGCRNRVEQALRLTSHLVKAVSVARAVGRCPFEARLVEVMGASDLAASTSVFPGKGEEVHQVLALAVPRLFHDYLTQLDFAGALGAVGDYVSDAFEELKEWRVPPVSEADSTRGEVVKRTAEFMAIKFVELVRDLNRRGLLDPTRARVRAELELLDYKMHVRGIADLVLEEVGAGRAVVVEWKTSRGRGEAPGPEEVVQGYVYAVAVAHRLGYDNGVKAVLECKVFPVIIRDSGRINPYSVSKCYKTAEKKVDEAKLLHEIQLAATHLVLSLVDFRKKVDKSWNMDKELSLCGVVINGRRKSAIRRVPKALLEKPYPLNPNTNQKFPCGYCSLNEACKFYLFSKREPEEVDRLAWRARYRVFGQRENAFLPLWSLAVEGESRGVVEGGARVDVFEELVIPKGGVLGVELVRRVTYEDRNRGVPLTVREGKPVFLFLKDVEEPIYRVNFSGNVGKVDIDDDYVRVRVNFEGRFSRLSYFLLRDLVEREPDLRFNVLAVEGNVDLTHIELMAIDAFQRATKELAKEEGVGDVEGAKRAAFTAGYKVKRKLYEIFGLSYVIK